MEGPNSGANERKSARVGAGRATRNSQSSEITQIPIPELLINKDFLDLIKKTIKKTIREEMQELKQEFAKLSKQVESNETNIVSLQIETYRKNQQITDLEKQLKTQEESTNILQNKCNDAEQYSRRNCIRVFGVPETTGEQTDDVIMSIAKEKLGVELQPKDLDRSHWIGRPDPQGRGASLHQQRLPATPTSTPGGPGNSAASTPTSWAAVADRATRRSERVHHRPIIVKFATYRAKQTVRRRLKNSGITIAEDLTSHNYEILKEARSSPRVSAAWSSDGRILVALPATNGKSVRKVIGTIEEARKLR